MKKVVIFFGVLLVISSLRITAPAAITVGGTNATIDPATQTTVSLMISLTTTGMPPADVTGLNLLLETPTTTAGAFSVQFAAGSTTFPTATGTPGTVSNFNTASTSHAGFTDSDPATDLGSSNPVAVDNTNGFTAVVDTLTFTILNPASIKPGTYLFNATLSFDTDPNGSFVTDTAGAAFAVTNAPQFSITVVPEPATCSLLMLGALGGAGLNVLRRRRAR